MGWDNLPIQTHTQCLISYQITFMPFSFMGHLVSLSASVTSIIRCTYICCECCIDGQSISIYTLSHKFRSHSHKSFKFQLRFNGYKYFDTPRPCLPVRIRPRQFRLTIAKCSVSIANKLYCILPMSEHFPSRTTSLIQIIHCMCNRNLQ